MELSGIRESQGVSIFFHYACGQWMSSCDILSRFFFFFTLGVSLTATVQKKLKPVNLGHHVRLNCQYNPTFDKWRPHTKWKKNVKWFKNGRRLRPKALPKNISIKNKRKRKKMAESSEIDT